MLHKENYVEVAGKQSYLQRTEMPLMLVFRHNPRSGLGKLFSNCLGLAQSDRTHPIFLFTLSYTNRRPCSDMSEWMPIDIPKTNKMKVIMDGQIETSYFNIWMLLSNSSKLSSWLSIPPSIKVDPSCTLFPLRMPKHTLPFLCSSSNTVLDWFYSGKSSRRNI